MVFIPQASLSPELSAKLMEAFTSPYSLFARAVVAGNAQGTVLVDNPTDPQEALILTEERLWWQPLRAMTDLESPLPSASLIPWIRDYWQKPANIYAGEPVMASLPVRLAEWRLPIEEAVLFTRDLGSVSGPAELPANLQMISYTVANIESYVTDDEREDLLEDAADTVERVGSFFPGYMLVTKDGGFVARCTIDYAHADVAEIGVETARAERKKGYSSLLVGYVLRELAKLGIRKALWHAPISNIASQKTALRSGFTKVSVLKYLICHASIAHNILACGYLADRKGQSLAAAQLYEEAVSLARQGRGDAEFGEEFTCEQVLEWAADLRGSTATPS